MAEREGGWALTGEAIRRHLLGLRVAGLLLPLCKQMAGPQPESSRWGARQRWGWQWEGSTLQGRLLEPLPAPGSCGLHARRQPAAWQPHLPAARSPSTAAQRSAGEPLHPCPNLSAVEGLQSLGRLPEVPPSLHCLSVVAAEFLSVSICKMGLITVPSQSLERAGMSA